MTAAAAAIIDEDLVCQVEIDQKTVFEQLNAMDQTLTELSLTEFAKTESARFVTNNEEVLPVIGVRGEVSTSSICDSIEQFYTPASLNEIISIVELSEKDIYQGMQLKWNVKLVDGLYISGKVVLGRYAVATPKCNETLPPTTVVGCVALRSKFPKLCRFESIQNPVAMCERIYSQGPPLELAANRTQFSMVTAQSKNAIAELRRRVTRTFQKMGYSYRARRDTSKPMANAKKESCTFSTQLMLFSQIPQLFKTLLAYPSNAEKTLSSTKKFLKYLDLNQARIQKFLESESPRRNIKIVPDMDSAEEIHEALTDQDLLNVQLPLVLLVGLALALAFIGSLIVYSICLAKIGRKRHTQYGEIRRERQEEQELNHRPTAPEVF